MVVVGMEGPSIFVNDPDFEAAPQEVEHDWFVEAWRNHEQWYAVLHYRWLGKVRLGNRLIGLIARDEVKKGTDLGKRLIELHRKRTEQNQKRRKRTQPALPDSTVNAS